ncbi:hypothetical protein BJV74DRAFT_799737 [Russula compacta]|nr:hypothetical protein BJV74DRAFT_799737 [Russula compacta]
MPICLSACTHLCAPACACLGMPTLSHPHTPACVHLHLPRSAHNVMKDPPNSTPLAEDLIATLHKIQLGAITVVPRGHEMILDPKDAAGIGMYVEDCNMEELGVNDGWDWVYREDNLSQMLLVYAWACTHFSHPPVPTCIHLPAHALPPACLYLPMHTHLHGQAGGSERDEQG